MRLEGVELEDVSGHGVTGYVPLEGLTVLFGANGAGKSSALEMVQSLLTPDTSYQGRPVRMKQEELLPYGRVHFMLERLDEPDGDWPWLRSVLESLDQQAPLGGIRYIADLISDWVPDDPNETYEDFLAYSGVTEEEDRGWGHFSVAPAGVAGERDFR